MRTLVAIIVILILLWALAHNGAKPGELASPQINHCPPSDAANPWCER